MRILVVEDEKRIADFLCRGLEGAGYAVDAAGNGATADPDRQTHGFNHVAFAPDGGLPALEQLHRRLIDKGAKIDRLEEHAAGRHKSVYFFDPDGNRLEFYWENPDWLAESAQMVKAAFGRLQEQKG